MKNPIRLAGSRALLVALVVIISQSLDLAMSAQSCFPLPAGALSWWPANGSALDFFGANDGILANGAGYSSGEVGQAFSFANASAAVDVGYATNLQIQDFTIEAWIKRSSVTNVTSDPNSSDGAIFSYGANGYGFEVYHDTTLVLTKLDNSGVFSSGTIADTSFHHVAVTKSGATVIFYIDGANAGDPSPYDPGFIFVTPASIGAVGDYQQNSFDGLIDELTIYNRALSAGEIQGIYAAGSAGKCGSLTIISQPTNEVGFFGGSNTFSVTAFGNPPLGYQWRFDSESLLNETNSVLTLTNLQSTNAGTYSVIVSDNSGRILSSNATLTLVTPVSITSDPTNVTAVLGGSADFSVSAAGTPPLSYQWTFNGTNILNATNSSYVVSGIDVSNFGLYGVIVSDPWSAATSAPAMLAFNPQITINGQLGSNFVVTTAPSAEVQISSLFSNASIFYTLDGSMPDSSSTLYDGPFAVTESATLRAVAYDQSFNSAQSFPVIITFDRSCVPPPAGMLSWWPADGTALDFTGTNNGVLTDGAGYGPGEVGQSFLFTNAMASVDVGSATDLRIQNFTIEAWIKRSSATSPTSDPNALDGAIFCYGANGYGFQLSRYTTLVLTKLDNSGVFSSGTVADTNFHHVAVTKSGSTVIFYIDGANAGESSYDPGFVFTTPARIGATGDFQQNSFYGSIDELAVYNRALSASEIQQIYAVGGGGKCTGLSIITQPTNEIGLVGLPTTFNVVAFGLPSVSYQWLFNTASITNATNSFLTLANVQTTNAGTYSVIVSDDSDRLLSSNAVLTVVVPVSITSGPSNVVATLGGSADFSVSAAGTPPLSYQWTFDDTNILDATNSTYGISSVAFSNIGLYSVMVSNPWSAVTSAPALLAFNPQITVNGQLGTDFIFTNIPSVQVQISSLFSNAAIFYTLNGASPNFGSTPYDGPFAVTQSATVQAIAYDQNFNSALSFPVDITLFISNTLTVINPGGGTVALNPPGGLYLNTQTVQATATPTNGWTFLQWSGAVSSANPVINVPMTSNQTLQAVFGTSITFSPTQNGSFQFNPDLPAFPYGSLVEISALPAPGYYFALWGGSASSATNPYVMTVTNPNPNIAALFAALPPGKFSLVVIPNGNGLVSVNPPGNSFASNTAVSITAAPLGTNKFYYWTGDATSAQNPLDDLAMRSNKVITANFSGGKYLIQFSSPSLTGTNFQFNLSGVPFQAYDIDVSSNLLDWTLLTTATNTDGSIPLSDDTSNAARLFYRAVLH